MKNGYGILTESKHKVILTCPLGHTLYKDGITIGTLYKNYNIRLHEKQCIKDGYDWSHAKETLLKFGCAEEDIEKSCKANRMVGLCPKYALTKDQFDAIKGKRRCFECEKLEG